MGKSKKPKQEVTEYFMSEHFGVCSGPVDAVQSIIVKEKEAWSGSATDVTSLTIDQPELFGGVKKEGGLQGLCTVLPGASDQILPDSLASRMGKTGLTAPGYRGLLSLFFTGNGASTGLTPTSPFKGTTMSSQRGFYWTANSPYLPGVWAKVQRIFRRSDGTDQWYPERAAITPVSRVVVEHNSLWEYIRTADETDPLTAPASTVPPSSGYTASAPAPFGNTAFPSPEIPFPIGTHWAINESLWLRKTINLEEEYDYLALNLTIENAVYAFWDGEYIGSINPNNDNIQTLGDTRIVIPGDQATAGAHTLHLYCLDDALLGTPTTEMTYVSAQVFAGATSDMNPAHIIHECLTNADWGMGTPLAALDDAAFTAAADTLYDEAFGLSMIWTRQASIQDFVQEVLDHIQAVLYADPATGLLVLKLVRGDYDAETLPVLDPDNSDISNFNRKLWGDIVNEIVVTWTNPDNEQDETITVQDDASIATQGGVVSDSRNYYGVRNAKLAQDLAYRDLRSAGQPLASCEAEVDRTQWQLRPASVVKLNWPEYGITGLVMRVTSVDYGKPGDPTIKLSMMEDVFGIDIGSYDEPPATEWADPTSAPAPIETVEILTLPYFMAQNTTVAAFVDSPEYPEVIAGVMGTTANDDTFEIALADEVTLVNGETTIEGIAELNVIGRGLLGADLAAEANSTGVTFTDLTGDTLPTVAGFAIIGDAGEEGNEIAMFGADTETLVRGILDTIPRAWPAGTPVWFVDEQTVFEDPIVRSAGETVDYKLLPRTSQGVLAYESADLESYLLTERPWLPNRPANVLAYGVAWSSETEPVDAVDRPDPWVTVTWSNRNRLTEDSQVLAWTDATVMPETGQTTTIEVLAIDGTVLATHADLTGTSFDVPDASFAGHWLARVRVSSSRTDDDGTFASLQAFEHWVQIAPLTFDVTDVTFDSDTWTMDEG